MKVTLTRQNEDYLLEGKGASGHSVFIDHKMVDNVQGSSPMELLLMAVGGCSAIDIISILKKQKQSLANYKVEVEGTRVAVKDSNPFESILVHIFLEGDIDPKKAWRAANLSFTKYCSVSLTLEPKVKISFQVYVNGKIIKQ